MIIDDICEQAAPKSAGQTVQDVRIGLGYTAVRLDSGACGLAYTFRDEAGEGCCVLREAGGVAGQPAGRIAGWARSLDAISTAVGLATLNALIAPPPDAVEANLTECLRVTADDVVGMVGYFGPLVAGLRQQAKALHIFERESGHPEVLPDWAATTVLPKCSVVILSATTLLNRTLDTLLEKCSHARTVALAGPSTPFLPQVFVHRRVTLLSGVQVVDAERVLRVVSEGGGTRQFGRAARKLTLHLPA